jgi:FkbM family methyltransferase
MRLPKTFRAISSHPLTSRARLAAVGRLVRWQIVSRLHRGLIVVPFVNDARLLARRGMTGATGNIYMGLHEFEEMSFVAHALRPNDLFVDAGANVGSYTVLAGKVAGAMCIAIEPVERAFESLLDNVALNRIQDRVDAAMCALGAEEGTGQFTADRDTTNRVVVDSDLSNSSVRTTKRMVEVPLRTLDDVVGDREPMVVKIDVEGYETQVVAGGQRTLGRSSVLAIIMETNKAGGLYGFDDAALLRRMEEMQFVPCVYDPLKRALRQTGEAEPAGLNTILVRAPKIEAVQKRLKTAEPFRVLGAVV